MVLTISRALEVLELTGVSPLTDNALKKQYHKLALEWHPDKNNSSQATLRFQEITEAYRFLMKDQEKEDNQNMESHFNSWVSMIFSPTVTSAIYELVMKCSANNMKTLDRDNLIEVFQWLVRYQGLFQISDDLLMQISELLIPQHVYILRPSINDMMSHSVYKLYVNNTLYLVPLWHSEMCFETPDGDEFTVLCHPVLPENIHIDEENRVWIEQEYSIHELFNTTHAKVFVGSTKLNIPVEELRLKKRQLYIFPNQGLSPITDYDVYNTSKKQPVIVKVILN